jgi:isoquinoline 1-oxidoreductase beta subunit
MRDAAVEATKSPPRFVRRRVGDPEGALAAAHRVLEAAYEVPLLAHATMEPMNCTAHATRERCEIWAPTQNPASVRIAVAAALGMPASSVTVHLVRMGGGFGRRFYADFAVEAALVSRAVGSPAQVLWTREDDMTHDYYRPAGYHLMRAGLDAEGELVAWTQHLATASRGAYLRWQVDAGSDLSTSELEPYDLPSGVVPHFLSGASPIESRIPRGQWRSVESSATVFVTQSFLAEVAHAAGKRPLDFQLEMLSRQPVLKHYGSTYETARLANVLRLAAREGALGDTMPSGWGRGIAGSYSNGAFVAHVADVEISSAGHVRVHRVVSAIDCGTVVNPTGVRAQVEGAVIYGLSAALKQSITVEQGRVMQRNFHEFDVMRMADAPRIDVHVVESDAPVCGVGETSLPPIAPAVTNAIFNATGVRVRTLPIGKVQRA